MKLLENYTAGTTVIANGEKVFPDSIRTNDNLRRDSILAVYRPRLNEEGVEVFSSYGKSRRYALANVDGTFVTDFIFAELRPGEAAGDLWTVSLPEKELYGFLDDEREVIIPYQFPAVTSSFEEGLAVVRVQGRGQATAVIDTAGNIILPADTNTNYQLGVEILNPKEGGGFEYYNRHGEAILLDVYEKAEIFASLKLPEK